MLGDIYLASALAIFFAIFGWSETIFGLSRKTKEKEVEFLKNTNLSRENYYKLRELSQKSNRIDPGQYLKRIMVLLKGTKLLKGGKSVFDKIGKNEKIIQEWELKNKKKKVFFTVLFFYLFLLGSFLIMFENSPLMDNQLLIKEVIVLSLYIFFGILSQIILLGIIVYGFFIYKKIGECEKNVQNNLNELISSGGN